MTCVVRFLTQQDLEDFVAGRADAETAASVRAARDDDPRVAERLLRLEAERRSGTVSTEDGAMSAPAMGRAAE